MSEVPDAPAAETAAAATPTANADVFADVAASTPSVSGSEGALSAAPPIDETTPAAVAEVQDDAAIDAPPADVPAAITMADVAAALEKQAADLTAAFEAKLASQVTPELDAKPADIAPPPIDDDIFVAAARSQIGADAEHAPPDLVDDRAQLLDKRAGWVRWQRKNQGDAAAQAKAQENITSLNRSLSSNLRDVQGAAYRVRQDAKIAELSEQVAANRDRPARQPVEQVTAKWNTGLGEHVIAQAAKLPSLAKAFASGSVDAAKITEGIDFSAGDDKITAAILARLPAWEHAAASMAQPATPPTTLAAAKPLGNPGILAPGSAPAAAGLQPYPTTNADVFASITKASPLPN